MRYLEDNSQAWLLLPDGRYEQVSPGKQPAHSAQEQLLAQLRGRPLRHAARRRQRIVSRATCARAEHPQPQARGAQVVDLLLQVGRGQRMLLQPARREMHLQRLRRRPRSRSAAARWGCGRDAAAPPAAGARSEWTALRSHGGTSSSSPSSAELAAMAADHARQQALLLAREAGHVGVLEQVGAMAVIAAVGDIEPDLVQARRPFQPQVGGRVALELPGVARLLQELRAPSPPPAPPARSRRGSGAACRARCGRAHPRPCSARPCRRAVPRASRRRRSASPSDSGRANTSARMAMPPGKTGRRSSVRAASFSSRTCPASSR